MKSKKFILVLLLIVASGLSHSNAQLKMSDDIWFYPVTDSVFVHATYATHPQYGRFSSNGLIVIRNGKALLVDTPVTDEQTKQLVKLIDDSLHAKVTHFVGCHWHEDCVGGLGYLNLTDVETICLEKTRDICRQKDLPVSVEGFTDSLKLDFEGIEVQCFYPGGGHTIDNIVVYVDEMKVLFGGCLVKSMQSNNLGNLADAVPNEWSSSIERVKDRFPNVKVVVPGHGNLGGKELLTHTLQLLKK